MNRDTAVRIALFTGPRRCGIAHYTESLLQAMPDRIEALLFRGSFDRLPLQKYKAQAEPLNDAEIIHIQHEYAYWGGMGPGTGYFAFMAALQRPVVMTVHELDLRAVRTRGLPAPLERAYKRWMNRRIFTHPSIRRWLTHSAEVTAGLVSLGVPEASVETLPMPVPEPLPLPPESEAKAALGLQDRRVLTIFGFLARRKGYDLALEALKSLPEDVVLLAAGGVHGADRSAPDQELQNRAVQAGVADRFRITGYLTDEQVPGIFAATDLLLAPFHELSGSASLALGQAYGRPILASDLPALRSSGAALFPAGDARALASEIARLLGSPSDREGLAAASRSVAARHSYRDLAERTVAIYEEMVGDAHRD